MRFTICLCGIFCLGLASLTFGQDSIFPQSPANSLNAPPIPTVDLAEPMPAHELAHDGQSVSYLDTSSSLAASEDLSAIIKSLEKLEKENKEAAAAKKKLPNVIVNGAFQADAVLFNQTE